MSKLFKITGFLSYILVIFLNAFVDLGHKIIIQNSVFKTYDGQEQIILTAIVNALILLPFILLFTPSGFLADKYPKNRVIKISAGFAVCLTCLITLFYYLGMFWAAFAMTFLMALQSAIYSPAKFGFIRELVGKERLSTANGLVQAVTMVAILGGTFAFSIMFESRLTGTSYDSKSELLRTIAPVGWFLILGSLIELILAFRLPQKQEVVEDMHFDFDRYKRGDYLKSNLRIVYQHPVIWLSIIGLSIFWAISQVLLASFPAFAKETMDTLDTVVIQGMMACAGIGIMFGSITSGKFSKNHIETGLLPVGAIGIAIVLLIMPNLNSPLTHSFNFLALGFLGGLFIVPLNALIQFHAKEHELGIVLAGNNLIQTSVMLAFLMLTVLFAWWGISTIGLIHLLTIVAVIGAVYTLYHLPQSFTRMLTGRLIASKYRLHVQGFDNIPENGGVLMLGNHISFIDWAILQMASPRQIRFVMARSYYERWYLKWFLDLFGVIPIAKGSSKQQALESITALLNKGEVVALFPEGTISRNGQLSEFKQGYEKAAAGAEGVILPFHLRGLWGSRFSRSSDKLKQSPRSGNRRDLIVAFGKPLPMTTRTEELKQRICALSIESWETYSHTLQTLPAAWLETAKRIGGDMAVTDASRQTLNNSQLMTASICLSNQIKHRSKEQNIGLLFPTSTTGVIANLAVLLSGKTIINLTDKNIDIAIKQANIKHIYTSQKFLQTLTDQNNELSDVLNGINIFYIDDLNQQISSFTRIKVLLSTKILPTKLLSFLYCKSVDLDSPATILFSNHNKKKTKGILLSHRNIMTNIKQVAHVLNTEESDIVMATLPLSHAFGFTVTTLMPLIEGIPIVCLPDPGNAINIAKSIARHNATILITTSSYLDRFNQNKNIHPLMLESLRTIVAGAEKLDPTVKKAFEQKFNKDIYEGYGISETSPVASVNVPDKLDTNDWRVQRGGKTGTVGMPLPGTSFRIVDQKSMQELPIGETGQILIGGPQLMLKYLGDTKETEEVITEIDNIRWFKTGDQGYLDQDGFLTIIDQNKL